jgi:hypothetical protein
MFADVADKPRRRARVLIPRGAQKDAGFSACGDVLQERRMGKE